jgi:hypothetical protein
MRSAPFAGAVWKSACIESIALSVTVTVQQLLLQQTSGAAAVEARCCCCYCCENGLMTNYDNHDDVLQITYTVLRAADANAAAAPARLGLSCTAHT